jgi:hypothetical protein
MFSDGFKLNGAMIVQQVVSLLDGSYNVCRMADTLLVRT